jgi:hypothetical protein
MPQASQLRCRLADTDEAWRDKLGGQTPQGRRIQVKFLQEGTSEAAADILFTGIIEEFSTGPGYVEIYAVSDELSWLDERIPDVITPENFPEYAKVEQAFLPVWLGHVVGKAVSLGFANAAPAEPAAGALVDAADAADALTAEILAAVFTSPGSLFGVLAAQQEWIEKIESKYAQALPLILNEFNLQYDAGVIELADAVYARDKLQDLLDAVDARATEYAAGNSQRAAVISNFRGGVTSFYGDTWETLLAELDAKIATLEGSPPAEAFAPQGAVPLPYIGGNRWGAAMHPLWRELCLYRKEPDEAVFTGVPIEEYAVTAEVRSFAEYPDRTFTCTFIDFLVAQPDGTEIRLDSDGAYSRDAFGSMPAAGYAADGFNGPLRNPVDGFLILKELILPKSATAANSNIDALIALRNKMETGGATMPPLFCDGVVNESMTGRELMGRFHATFQTDFYHDKKGRETLKRIDDTDDGRPEITEHVIVRNTWGERSPNPTVNRYRANYGRDYATDNWFDIALADNLSDQEARQKVQDATVDFWFARDAQTALAATQDRLRYTALGSYRQRAEVPLPQVSAFLELAKLVGWTHYRGMQISGYHNREAKIIGYSIDLDGFKVAIDSIVRVALPFGERQLAEANFDAGAPMTVEESHQNEVFPISVEENPVPDTVANNTTRVRIVDGEPEYPMVPGDTLYYSLDITGGSGVSPMAKEHYRFPEPDPLKTLTAVTMKVRLRKTISPAHVPQAAYASLYEGTNLNDVDNGTASFGFGAMVSADFATYESSPVSAATWNSYTDPVLAFRLFDSSGEIGSPYPTFDISEVKIVYHYA